MNLKARLRALESSHKPDDGRWPLIICRTILHPADDNAPVREEPERATVLTGLKASPTVLRPTLNEDCAAFLARAETEAAACDSRQLAIHEAFPRQSKGK